MTTGGGAARAATALLPGLRRTGLLALAANGVLELSQLVGVEGWPWQFKQPAYPLMFLLGTLVVWLVVGLVQAVLGSFRVTAAVVLVAAVVLSFASHEKTRLLDEPLYPSDLHFAGDGGFLVDMIGVRAVLGLVVAVLLALAVALFLRPRRAPAPELEGRARIGVRVLTGVLCLASLAYLAGFNRPGNEARATYDALGAMWQPFSQKRNYLTNGFVGGVLFNMRVPTMQQPPGYDEVTMARIASRYARAAQHINRSRRPHGLDHVNVVMVLSESFSDPTRLSGVRLDEDPIPYTRSLLARTPSGAMLARDLGHGTANMEFEALTGMSMANLSARTGVPYQTLVPGHRTFPSVVGWLHRAGHATVAIHPFTTEMYRRREVYRAFGIDHFVHDTTMREHRRIGHDAFISDTSAFDELEHRLRTSKRPLLANVVTMQNHQPYTGRYDDPVGAHGPGGEDLPDLGQYARGLTYSDEALRDLVSWLRGFDEPTVLVFYGDHLPSTYPDDVVARNGLRMRETPYFVWSNVPGRVVAPPLVSPAHFVDLALEQVRAPVSPYYALLTELRRRVPAMESGRLFGADGQRLDPRTLSPQARRLLHDYRLVQYDLAMGHRWSEAALSGPVSGPSTPALASP